MNAKALAKKQKCNLLSTLNYFYFLHSASHSSLGVGGRKEKSPVYSEFPAPFKLIMGSGTEAFTVWDINYYFSIWPKVLGVNSLYCMKCQSNYC